MGTLRKPPMDPSAVSTGPMSARAMSWSYEIGQVKFYFQIYLSSPENICLNVGDISDKKGYFFCAGFILLLYIKY